MKTSSFTSKLDRAFPLFLVAALLMISQLACASVGIPGPKAPSAPDSPPTRAPSKRIAFVSNRDGNPEIYVMNADGSAQTNLTKSTAAEWFPVWAPDGARIAFVSDRGGNTDVYVMNADGSDLRNLTNSSSEESQPVWSPDGERIAFVRTISDKNRDIYVVNAEAGSEPAELVNTSADDWGPAWSPDGTQIAFISRRDGEAEIYLMNADGSSQTNLTNKPGDDLDPSWSPDSTRIAFASNSQIYVMNVDGTDQTSLANIGDAMVPLWSPDGTKVVFTQWILRNMTITGDGVIMDQTYRIYIVNADGSGLAALTDRPDPQAIDRLPAWRPDSKQIVFASDRDGNYEIYAINADGTGVTRLTSDAEGDFYPSWQP